MIKKPAFETEKRISLVSNDYVSLTQKEIQEFTKMLSKVKRTLKKDLPFVEYDEVAISSIQDFIEASKIHLTFEEANGILFAFGIFINKIIIEMHDGKLVKNKHTGDIDVYTNNTIISSHTAIIEYWATEKNEKYYFLDFLENVEVKLKLLRLIQKKYYGKYPYGLN